MKASTAVGTRELKTRLGTYLRRVREGERILVTDRGEPVAELRGLPDDDGLGGRLALLEAKGLVSRPSRRSLKPLRAIRSRGASLAQAIVEDRENRF
ncbi:MAG: type II toxin-antitoxin system Phd/YefM family antitoxin [Vicinamibacteria bacterium]